MKLTLDQIIQYQTDGYLVAEDVLTDRDLAPVIAELEQIIDERARALKAQGKITDLCERLPFAKRFAALHAQSPQIGSAFDIMHLRGEAMFEFLRNGNLLDVVECLLGSELSCNPIQHIRAKLPAALTSGKPEHFQNVPWHQDNAVTLEEAEHSEIITFWLPLVDATAETGCMEVLPRAFKLGELKHQAEGGTMIVPDQMPDLAPKLADCRKGGIVIMNKYTPHRGTPNTSDVVRWSIDLRYHKTGAPSGRPFHPEFVARSRSNPSAVLTDHAAWSAMWKEALESGGHRMHRV